MTYTNFSPAFFKVRRCGFFFLITACVLGFIFGYWIFGLGQALFSSLMRSASCYSVSIVGLLLVVALPFLISALAVAYNKPLIIYILCFVKSILYSVCAFAVYSTYGSAGWLMQFLVLFLDNCTMVFLWIVWGSYTLLSRMDVRKVLAICFGLSVLAWVLDCYVISQFAVSVINS